MPVQVWIEAAFDKECFAGGIDQMSALSSCEIIRCKIALKRIAVRIRLVFDGGRR